MPTQDTGRNAQSILEFCRSHGFSRALYYKLTPEERPDETQVRGRKIITAESAAKWRRQRTAASKRAASGRKRTTATAK